MTNSIIRHSRLFHSQRASRGNGNDPKRAGVITNHARQRGVALVLVLFAIATAFILSLSFMSAQSTNAGIARNVQNQAQARQIAESMLGVAIEEVKSNSSFRNQFSDGVWITDGAFANGFYTIYGFDGMDVDGDGDLANNSTDPVTLIVIANFGGATHRSSVVIQPGLEQLQLRVLLVVDDATSLTVEEEAKRDLIDSFGYEVIAITDSASQAEYDTELVDADAVYISREANDNSIGSKLSSTTVGVVSEHEDMHKNLGFSATSQAYLSNSIEITDNSHFITETFSIGPLVISTADMTFLHLQGADANGAQVLGDEPGGSGETLTIMEVGAERKVPLGPTPGRRVALPWGDADLSIGQLNNNGIIIMRRSLEWATQPPLGPPALAHWRLDDGSGNIAKDDRSNHDGDVFGGGTWAAGMLAGSLEFDGANDYIQVPDHDDFDVTNAFSVSAWILGVNWGSGADIDVILRKGEGNPNKWQVGIKDGKPTVFLETYDDYGIKGNTTLAPNQWYHVAATWDGSRVKIYVNGVLDNGPNGASHTTPIGIDARPLYIGGRGGTTDLLDGLLDDVRFYDRALNPKEIETMFEEGQQAGKLPRLIARYTFNEIKPNSSLLGHWPFDESPTGGGGLAAHDDFRVRDTARIDSYNSNGGAYQLSRASQNAFASTNQTGSSKFSMHTSSSLWGHAFCGVGGSPNSVINAHEGAISGKRLAQDANVPMPALSAPSSMPATQGSTNISSGTTWVSDQTFDGLTLSGSAVVTVSGNIRVHCTDDFTATDTAQLIIGPGSSLELYVADVVDIRTNARLNNDSTRTNKLKIINYGVNSNSSLTIRNNAMVAGELRSKYNVTIRDDAVMFGSIRTASDLLIENRAQVHVDTALPGIGITDPPASDETGINAGLYRNGVTGLQTGAAAHTGSSIRFDGVDDFVEIPHHDRYLTRSGAVSFWFKTDQTNLHQGLFSKDSSGFDDGGQLTIKIQGNKVRAVLESTLAENMVQSANISANTWYHVAFSYGPDGMRLFMNGTLVGQNAYTGGLGSTSGGNGNFEPIAIGANTQSSGNLTVSGYNELFKGNMDDVRLFTYALDAGQVANVMAGQSLGESTLAASVIPDDSNFGTTLDVHIPDTSKISWEAGGGLNVNAVTTLLSALPAKKITDTLKLTNELTIELIFTPVDTFQTGPARIVSFSTNSSSANFMVGQNAAITELRMRTTSTSTNGTPAVQSGNVLAGGVEQHIVMTFDGENINLYRNGSLIKTEARTGTFATWNNTWPIAFASEPDGSNRWLGKLSRVAIYDRSLNQYQVNDVFRGLAPSTTSGKSTKVTWIERP